MISFLNGVRFDTHEGNMCIEVDARIQFASHVEVSSLAMASDGDLAVDKAKDEAVELIRRQVYGELEDAIKGSLEDYMSHDARLILEDLLGKIRPNKN